MSMGEVMQQRCRKCVSQRARRPIVAGFTLIELVVTVAIIGVVATIAVPSMQGLLRNNRLNAAAGELSAALQLARSEATRRNAAVTICNSTNGTTCAAGTAWTRWIVVGRDRFAAVDDVMRDESPLGGLQVSGPAAGIRFRPSGLIDAQTMVTVCMPTTNPNNNQRALLIRVSGTVSSSLVDGGGACP